MPRIEPDEGLPFCLRPVSAGMDVDGLVDRIACRRFERVLDLTFRVDVIAGGPGVEHDALLVRRPLSGNASDRQHTGAEHKLEERATMVERNDHSISRVLGIDGQ